MWLFWLKLISIFIVVLSGAIAAFREMHPRRVPSKIPSFLFVLAITFGATAITTEIVGHFVQKESEQQRVADLQYIQALDLPVVRVGLDLILEPVSRKQDLELQWVFRYDRDVPTIRGEEHFYNLINMHFSPDSGWSILNDDGHDITVDSSQDHLMLWINDFGIKKHGKMIWEPKRVADLTGIQILMGLSPHKMEQDLPTYYQFLIRQVDIYVNSSEPSNRIVAAPAYRREYSPIIEFRPKGSPPYVDPQHSAFYLNPYELRNSILESIKNSKQ